MGVVTHSLEWLLFQLEWLLPGAEDIFVLGALLFLGGFVLALVGIVLIVVAAIARNPEPLYQDKNVAIGDPSNVDYVNVMLPLSENAQLAGYVRVLRGPLKFRIVGYFGSPAGLVGVIWISNTFYPNDGKEYLDIVSDFELPKLNLLKRDYVCEFHIVDRKSPFEVVFTVIAKRKRWPRGGTPNTLGQTFLYIGVTAVAIGITTLATIGLP